MNLGNAFFKRRLSILGMVFCWKRVDLFHKPLALLPTLCVAFVFLLLLSTILRYDQQVSKEQ